MRVMYSRTPAPPPQPMGRPSYIRSHNMRPDFKVPVNYSGNAFPLCTSEDEGYVTLPREDPPIEVDGEPVTDIEDGGRGEPDTTAMSDAPDVAVGAERSGAVMNLQHFPFGHGIGFEELLLLGLIFFLLQEGEGQENRGDLDETVLLLAILLFCG